MGDGDRMCSHTSFHPAKLALVELFFKNPWDLALEVGPRSHVAVIWFSPLAWTMLPRGTYCSWSWLSVGGIRGSQGPN